MAKDTPFDRARDFVEEKIDRTKEVLGDSYSKARDQFDDVRNTTLTSASLLLAHVQGLLPISAFDFSEFDLTAEGDEMIRFAQDVSGVCTVIVREIDRRLAESADLFLSYNGSAVPVARLKFLESPTGARLDFWGDNLVHVAVWISMAIGFSLEVDSPWPLLPGALAVAGTAISAVLVSRRSSTAPTDATARLADAVANRDFIYLVLLLACFGKAHWFLILVALGTPIFMLLVRWGARRRQAA